VVVDAIHIGGNGTKKELASAYYSGQERVLEVGCSVGNISSVFCGHPHVRYTGIDIDERALDCAKRRFRRFPNFVFSVCSLEELAAKGESFEYVLFAGILHHVDDWTCHRLLRTCLGCLDPAGRLVIYDPELPRPNDSRLLHFFCHHFEQGRYMRKREHLQHLLESAGVILDVVEDRMVSPGLVARPHVARFNLFVGHRSPTD
jgi:2-polyprenyl-3-methyl-5-hydroxy-6-metoxy-1,4-benzoquinol methylase